MGNFRFFLRNIGFFFSLILLINTAFASFSKDLWPQWEVHNPLSTATISHAVWQKFLDNCVISNEEGINLVDYAHLNRENRALLKKYINDMAHVSINNFNRSEQLAYWINFYNASTVAIVAHYYPISSIEDINISPGLFSIGPWGAKLVNVNGVALSLEEIHNRIIRPIWNDPRTHYALNNGSIGAANLGKKAYLGTTLNTQLNDAATQYINSLRGVQVIEKKLIVSKIFEWFNDDFGSTKDDIITHLKQFARQPLRAELDNINTIESYIYNWHLNSTVENNP